MKLYGSPTSPYVRKARVVALELGIELELERADAHAMPSDYGAINPVNRIPALRLDDGSMMFDSRVICEYLDSLCGRGLLAQAGAERWQVLKTVVFGDGIMDAAVPRYSEILRPPEQQSPARIAKYQRSIAQTLDALELQTAEMARLNLGSIAVGCALSYLDFRFAADAWREGRPRLAAWFGEFERRSSMQATLPTQQWLK